MKPLLKKVDAVTLKVPDLDVALAFYRDRLGRLHEECRSQRPRSFSPSSTYPWSLTQLTELLD